MRLIFSFLIVIINASLAGQVQVSLDNWYNRETSSKTGKPFHYLWTDTENSGFSRLGKVFTDAGAKISTLENAPAKADLAKTDIYIIVDPDTTTESASPNYILTPEIKLIKKWVKKGGVLLLMANDGPNCEFTHFNQLAGQFGMYFNAVTLNPVKGNQWEMGAETNLPDHPLFMGVSKIYMKEVSPITIKGNAQKVLTDGDNIYIAESGFGKGFVLAIGDPWLYNEYIDNDRLPQDFENRKAAENMVKYLLEKANNKK